MTTINIFSYGCRHGDFPRDTATLVIPCHDIPNPHSNEGLREMDGRDPRLQAWVMGHKNARFTLDIAREAAAKAQHPSFPRDDFTIAFECIGGRHRSATLAETLHNVLTEQGVPATLTHRDIDRNRY